MVVDPTDDAGTARTVGRACRQVGRFVVHASPVQAGVARLQVEVLMALGKHWNRAGERGDATGAQLVSAWLRAEAARELTVLRAHQIRGAALDWLLGLPASEGLLLRLVSPEPLAASIRPELASSDPAAGVACDGRHPGRCEDLNEASPPAPAGPARLTPASARRLRRLYDVEAAALAAASLALASPTPAEFAALRPRVSSDATLMITAGGADVAVPEYVRALLRAWAGRHLLDPSWAADVAAVYLTLRLELASRHSGLQLIDPALPRPAPLSWRRRSDPGAGPLERLIGLAGYEPAPMHGSPWAA